MINYWSRNADNLLIGKFVGEQSLGIYNRAYTLMLLPLNNISRVVARVMFPSFSQIKNNLSEIKRIYLKISETIAFITFPLMFGLAITADVFVPAIYGSNWNAMISILQVLSIVGAFQSLLSLCGSIYIAMGKAKMSFRLTLIYNISYVIGFVSGLILGGLQGLVYIYSILAVIGVIPHLYITGRLIALPIKTFFKRLASVFIATTLMVVIVFLAKRYHLASIISLGLHWQLLIYVLLGAVSYLLFCDFLKVEAYISFKERLVRFIRNHKWYTPNK
jgi:PST family polysaccharide transporter